MPTIISNYLPYSDGTYGGQYYASGGSDANGGNPTSGTVTCSGGIKATFTWTNGGDPNNTPPKCVIITESCTVGWSGQASGGATATGNCTNPLGGYSILELPGPGYTWRWTRYTVQNDPPATLTVSCSPEADAQAAGSGAPYSSSNSGASVVYSASISPFIILPTGGIGPSDARKLLIGQQFSATLGSPLTPTSWNWTVSGGSPFKNWAASDNSAVYTPLGPETGYSLVCNFAKPDSVSVSCAAHLAVPSDASPSGGLDVTATQTLTTVKPSAQLSIICGIVTDLPTSTNPTNVQLQQYYRYPPDGNAYGIAWYGLITTPAAYVTSGDYGSWNWTQLITASRQEKNNGVYWQFAVDTTSPPTVINGTQVLDGTYPYGYFWYPANGATPAPGSADSPQQSLDPSNAISEYNVTDSFKDYLMYLPPGSGSIPVPLQENDWFWHFQALKNASSIWSTNSKNAQWGYVADFPAFPVWTFCASVGHLTYVSP